MLNQESLADIHVLHQQGHSIRAISRQLGIARNTVRSYLRDIARTPNYGPRPERTTNQTHRFYQVVPSALGGFLTIRRVKTTTSSFSNNGDSTHHNLRNIAGVTKLTF